MTGDTRSDRYEQMDHDTLLREARRMGAENTQVWDAFSRLYDAMKLAQPCHYCGALPGDWCLTKTANRVQYLHACREYAVMDIAWGKP